MNRKTANRSSIDGRLISIFLNWFRNPEKICPIRLSRFIAIVDEMSLCINPPTISFMFTF